MKVIRYTDKDFAARLRDVTSASSLFDAEIEQRTRAILQEVYLRGDAAVLEFTARFDGATLAADQLAVSQAELFNTAIAADDSLAGVVVLRRAGLLDKLDRAEEGVTQLKRLAETYPAQPQPMARLGDLLRRRAARLAARQTRPRPVRVAASVAEPATGGSKFALAAFALVLLTLVFGGIKLVVLLHVLSLRSWGTIVGSALLTLGRVLASTAIGTLWALPAGLAIGLSPKLSRIFQPVIQVAASFPAPMLFPVVIAVLDVLHVPLGMGSIVLMLLGTQWYILFNVIAGAMSIPADLKEAAKSYQLNLVARLRTLYIPAVFSYLVTGWVTAAGGAWNASIVSEYVTFKGRVLTTPGVGSAISRAAEAGDLPALAAGVLVMSTIVMVFNRNVWRRCYRLAEERYSLNR